MADPERGALMLVRVIAVAFIGFGVINAMLVFVDASVHHQTAQNVSAVIHGWPALIGVVILIRSKQVAGMISDWLDL